MLDEVFFNGHPVVAVVAETEAIAEDATALGDSSRRCPDAPRVGPDDGGDTEGGEAPGAAELCRDGVAYGCDTTCTEPFGSSTVAAAYSHVRTYGS